jgi:malate dehydrogenase
MPFVAVVGGGPIGAEVAHKLAVRGHVHEVRLIDAEERIVAGKALDILQSSPIEPFSTRISGTGALAAAAGALAIVLADRAAGDGEHTGEAGLALLRQIAGIEAAAPLVFAGASQRELMARAVRELSIASGRLIGSAPLALESALRSLAGLSLDTSGVAIGLTVVGVPPRSAVVAWEEASLSGQPLTTHLAAHEIAAMNSRLPGLWPPGPYALASAACRVVEAIANGSRRRLSCFAADPRGIVSAAPVELSEDGVRRVLQPILTPQERTRLENSVEALDVER